MPEVEKFDEKRPPFWVSWQIQSRRFLHVIQAVIYDFARRGNAVIVGRGGQTFCGRSRGGPSALYGPVRGSGRRIMARENADEKQATRLIHRSDRDSAGYLRFFFDLDWEDPALYEPGYQHAEALAGNRRGDDCETGGDPGDPGRG